MKKILFICLGNICRSPMAEAVLRSKAKEQNIDVSVDSAGIGSWHIGDMADSRTLMVLKEKNIDTSNLIARQINNQDYADFDYIIAMDPSHMQYLQQNIKQSDMSKLKEFWQFVKSKNIPEIPDPYYGDEQGFYDIYDLIDEGCNYILQELC